MSTFGIGAPFRMNIFQTYSEFEGYLGKSDAERGIRWLYERSLASPDQFVVLPGTCGPCLQPTSFTALTRDGEAVSGGRIPNWRESLMCSCEYGLINRERAVLHYLLAQSLLFPWTRMLALGEVAKLSPALSDVCDHVECLGGPLTTGSASRAALRGGYHLILSVEQLTANLARPNVVQSLAGLLAPGGEVVFTAPFIVAPPSATPRSDGPVGWEILEILAKNGFRAARICIYWSEEFGYLGPFNTLMSATRV